jgi:hypothetical protein
MKSVKFMARGLVTERIFSLVSLEMTAKLEETAPWENRAEKTVKKQ